MPIRGWYTQYSKLLKDFGYSRSDDTNAARILDGIIKKPISENRIRRLIFGKTVIVIGAGPSLGQTILASRRLPVTKIVADSAVKTVLKTGIIPDIVVTDLDGDLASLQKADDLGSLMLVHAHGDNVKTLPIAKKFVNVMATTQGRPVGHVRNYGGFTDGDRCVFLAESFGAEKIILFGMDLGRRIGIHSSTARKDMQTKMAKLRRAKILLEWLAERSKSRLYTTSSRIRGFENIRYDRLDFA
ncbi:MAG: putative Rossmann fold-containing protein [Cenarchaeum symbiont of Oopsacas minuta]|nr:putative Rossmann fold-containing protein [Cenarchaeum symbiont of Oopsacas minuta]